MKLKKIFALFTAMAVTASFAVVSYADDYDDYGYYDYDYNYNYEPEKIQPTSKSSGGNTTQSNTGARPEKMYNKSDDYGYYDYDYNYNYERQKKQSTSKRSGGNTTQSNTGAKPEKMYDKYNYEMDTTSNLVTKSVTIRAGASKSISSIVGGSSNISWSSSDNSIAYVSGNSIYGNNAGSTVIFGSPYSGYGDYYNIYVNVTKSSSSNNGTSRTSRSSSQRTISKNVSCYVGSKVDLDNYTSNPYYDYSWSTRDKSYATVNKYGEMSANKKGTVYIYAKSKYSDVNSVEFKVTIKETPSSAKKAASSNKTYTGNITKSTSSSSSTNFYDKVYKLYLNNGQTVDVSEFLSSASTKYNWKVDDKNVATANSSRGSVKGVGYGSSSVSATSTAQDVYFYVNVSKYFSNVTINMDRGGSVDISKYLDSGSKYTYTYYDDSIAKVNSDNRLIASKAGSTYVICESKNSNNVVQLMVNVSK